MNLIKQNAHITYAEIGETLALGETSVYKILKHLRQKNLIHRKGGRVFGYWVVNNSESFENRMRAMKQRYLHQHPSARHTWKNI